MSNTNPQNPYGQQPPPYNPPPQPPYGGYYGGGQSQPPPRPPRKKGLRWWQWTLIGTAGLIALIIVVAAVTPGNPAGNSQQPISATSPAAEDFTDPAGGLCAPANESNGWCPNDSPSATGPQYTVAQQQAIDSANSYLQTEPGWSYQGLIDQLDSPYGGQFAEADATFAVNTIAPAGDTAFWDGQAADSAKSYVTTEPGWSCAGLVQQLDSPYGGKFTQAQAEYGAQSVGLGTC